MHRTTILLDDQLEKQLKQQAKKIGISMSELIRNCLRYGLAHIQRPKKKPPYRLPAFSMGKALVDISDRDKLWDQMETSCFFSR